MSLGDVQLGARPVSMCEALAAWNLTAPKECIRCARDEVDGFLGRLIVDEAREPQVQHVAGWRRQRYD
ncbi:hypothetical protein E1N52_17470 [Paraburkholderia guartelaensis]|uniref:Uncharacterized protein n=1 Tax=Paraburkholderia guartelaensis TaxID=2546446 RepID=A0A4R5LCU7_9BURK|nr:hypothetical protein [Paraburkholderia guartelaensis]TDG07038.1 hypothetical protein E1N52_17470 [Paraburkholderia guartelaensis]